MSSFGGILLKMGSGEIIHNGLWKSLQQALWNWKVVVGLSFYVLPSFIWIYMLKKLDISFLQPLFSLVYVVTPALAFMILHENITLVRWIGITIIIFGIFIVAKS